MLTPLPGTQMSHLMPEEIEYEEINFSPTWRENYREISRARLWIYAQFAVLKLLYHPLKFFQVFISILTRRFRLKGDMTIYRFIVDFKDRIFYPVFHKRKAMDVPRAEFYPPSENI
jgi:hypothetical protein